MTARDFITWAQGYYGKYPDGQKRDVWDYVRSRSPEYLDALKKTLLKRYSAHWGKAPDVGIFEDNRREATDMAVYRAPAIEDMRPLATDEDFAAFREAFRAAAGGRK